MSTSVEDLSDRLEGLLTGRVPYLQLKGDTLHADEEGAEFDTDRHFMILSKLIMTHSVHQT